MANKRMISFLLALTMMLGICANPAFAASSVPGERKEVNYEIQEIDGKTYKVYKVSELGLKNPEKLLAPKYRNRAAGDPMEDWVKVKLISNTVGLTLGNDFNFKVYVALKKDDTEIAEATINPTEEDVENQVYHFVKTDKYDENNPDHQDPDKWYLIVPTDFRYEIRLEVGDGGNFTTETVTITVAQRAMPLYKAVWFTNNTEEQKPTVKATYYDGKNRPHEVDLNKNELAPNEYKSVSNEGGELYVSQKRVIVKDENKGTIPRQDFLVSDMKGAALWRLIIDQNGEKKTKGTIEDGDTKYHFNITGDYKTPFVATMREELNVKFDPNGATFDQAVKTEQAIGHSMKIGEAFGDLEAVKVPTKDQISNIPQKDNKDQDFIGWVVDEANKDLDFSNGQNRDKLVDPNGYEVKDNITFYAVYAPKDQGKVAIQYVDEKGNAIDDKYKIKGEDYPEYAEGNKGEDLEASKVHEPKFIGYKRTADPIDVTGKTYKSEQIETVEVKYEKLPDIIPEKKDGKDNPDVTPDVKEHYAKVTYQVAAADAEKAKLQLDGNDATSPLVYYVNPLEGKKISDVANVKAVSKDNNFYKVDANDMWTYDPESISGTDQVISQARDEQDNVVKTEITLTAKVADKIAAKFVDKLDPETIKVWVGDTIDWKKGVKLKEANEELQKILDAEDTKVTDESNRNSDAANLPNGEEGNLKVTFSDGSSLVVNDQMLYVAPHKNDDNTNLPKDAVKVEFKIGEGVTGTEKTMYVKPGTDVKSDAPEVSLKEGYKDFKWYKGNEVAKDEDFKVSSEAIFTAKAGQTDAQKYGDQLKAQDIVKWVGDKVDWKDGVKPIEGATFKKVEDLSNRSTAKAGVFPGKLKVTFGDDSTKEIDGQRLIVRDKKGDKVTPNENDPGTYPKDALEVKFVAGKGIKALDPANKVMVLKSGETLEAVDYPAVTVKDGFKTKADKTDYYDVEPGVITEAKTITASTTELGKGTAVVKFVDTEGKALDPKGDAKLQLAGQSYDQSFSGQEGVAITYDKSKAPKILGYEFTNEDPVINPANFEEGKEATITLKYKKLADVIPGEGNTKPDGYVTVKFTAQKGAKLTGETTYYVNPKAGKTFADTKAPTVESTDAKKYEVKTGKDLWKPELDETKTITKDSSFEAQVIELGKPVVNYPDVDLEKGGSKDVTPEIKDNKGNPQKPTKTPEILDENNQPVKPGEDGKITVGDPDKGIKITPKEDGTITVEVPKNYDGPNTIEVPVQVTIPGEDEPIKTTLKIKVIENKPEEPKPVEPKKRDDYINLVPVGEEKVKPVTDVHAIYLYGYPGNTVQPQGNMTRAEAAAMVARLKNLDMSDTSKPDFKDVESKWYNSAINAVVKAGLMKGYPDGTFAPNGKITRAEFAQLIKGIDLANSAELPFTDVAGHWGIGAISQAYANKRIAGYPDNTFRPNNDITRAEAVTILNNLFDRKVDETGLAGVRGDIVEFKDLSRSHWAYYEIVEASNTHEFYRQKDGEVTEAWVRVLKTWNDFLN
ncbi:hypothetical protein PEPNEM18_00189 [Aedoeadaptatus nemausensis]|uniref:SLH domain-containing protein n=1 Tax=Aedoeadaptatus nemausensis TaxID=2582829 RepID=A0A6V6XYW7_9FIRM|nr:S-layer homology domain-containing protein [Peptoniphilus nemausensis]CAC9923794.1 hypothetical protein PEPNEM18_00189 [Peptoniphilus nemausensis]